MKETEILKKKKAVLKKFYGGKREVYFHDFRLSDGRCKKCNEFIGDAESRMCGVIGREEVDLFRNNGFD